MDDRALSRSRSRARRRLRPRAAPAVRPTEREAAETAGDSLRWVGYLPDVVAATLLPLPPGSTLQHFRVVEVRAIKGTPPRIDPARRLSRIESGAPLPQTQDGGELVGVTHHHGYASAADDRRLRAVERTTPGALAVLVPVSKSDEWWSLAQDQRLALLRGSSDRPGHIALGAPFASRILRRLYHARYLPGSRWDFLAHFEFDPRDEGTVRQLLATLRDPARSSEWQYVSREAEVWLEREWT